jgi:hypothetical protein
VSIAGSGDNKHLYSCEFIIGCRLGLSYLHFPHDNCGMTLSVLDDAVSLSDAVHALESFSGSGRVTGAGYKQENSMGTFFICLMLAVIAWLLWLNYQTLDGFNEDLKQLRLLVAHIERHVSGEPVLPIEGPTQENPAGDPDFQDSEST